MNKEVRTRTTVFKRVWPLILHSLKRVDKKEIAAKPCQDVSEKGTYDGVGFTKFAYYFRFAEEFTGHTVSYRIFVTIEDSFEKAAENLEITS